MPSKSKKNTKTHSRLSASEAATPRTPSTDSVISEEELVSSCEEASRKFPSLIGKNAVIGEVSDVETTCRGCKIWLSESSMVSAYLAPGSLVSVNFLLF